MHLVIKTHLKYLASQPCDVLLQIEALSDETQRCRQTRLMFAPPSTSHEVAPEDGADTRRWVQTDTLFECHYETKVQITRPVIALDSLCETPRGALPAQVIPYLLPSRYCHPELFLTFVAGQFGEASGGHAIARMRDWIAGNFTYDSAASFAGATATDSFASQSGVCRDYAHVLITFARAAGIPARFASVYAPDVTPQDFHAVAEVYLDGGWHLVDPTGMSRADETVRICTGRDAADASFMTSYGWLDFQAQSVSVTRSAT